jgi:glycosyltransferase involved in cell wall biosynthesis
LTVHDVNVPVKPFRFYKTIFAISKSVKDDIFNRCGMESILIYNGICIEKISQKTDSKSFKTFKIVIVSRLEHEKKGQHIILEALHLLKEKHIENIHVDFIGVGDSEFFLKELVLKFDIANQVSFLGLKDRDYIYTHLKNYNLLIQPSIFEGFGLTVVEGMAAKIPVLVSNIDGPMEIIENGKFGYYFKVGDAKDLSDKILIIISLYSTYTFNQKIEDAYKHIKQDFDIANTSTNYLLNY